MATVLFLSWLPFLLVFYPAPGMDDTIAIIRGGGKVINQFPWAYSILFAKLGHLSRFMFGTREPAIFLATLIQMIVMATGLSYATRWILKFTGKPWAGCILYIYFMLFPMVGNYSIAAVRDPLYSLAILLWVLFIIDHAFSKQEWNNKTFIYLATLLMGTMFFRSNAPLIMSVLIICLVWEKERSVQRKIVAVFLVCLMVAIVPGHVIMKYKHIRPLFQESIAMPLQQVGRTFALSGHIDSVDEEIFEHYFPREKWIARYNPTTVDPIKWNKNFNRGMLNKEKKLFLTAWLHTMKYNFKTYVEAWMLTSYWNWNVKLLNPLSQSRFGWALDDSQTNPMKPEYSGKLSPGKLPIPEILKDGLAYWH